MKFEATLKKLDRYLWRPCTIVGSVISRIFPGIPDKRAAILRPGGMGDLIMLCVAAEELGLDPRSFFWVIEQRAAIWAKHLGLDHVCFDTALGTPFRFRGRFRMVFNSEQFFGLAQAMALAIRAPRGKVAGFDTNRAAGMNDIPIPYNFLDSHESVEFARLLSPAAGRRPDPLPLPVRMRTAPPNGKLVVGLAGLQMESRRFTAGQWVEMVKHWVRDQPFVVVAAPQDTQFARELCAQFGTQASLFQGGFSAMCTMVSEAPAVFTVDGGFLHIASYYGIPTTAIFTSSIDKKWAPLAEHSRVVRRDDLACQPCARFAQVPACPHHYACKNLGAIQISNIRGPVTSDFVS